MASSSSIPSSSSLHHLLSSLRSPIFNTSHNPTNARTGAKYLKRRLKGPSAINYYPTPINLKKMNSKNPFNRYANWEGISNDQFKRSVTGSSSYAPTSSPTTSTSTSTSATTTSEGTSVNPEGSGEGNVGSVGKTTEEGGESENKWDNMIWKFQSQMLSKKEIVPPGYTEVERIKGAGWLDDAKERLRREEVSLMRMMGRGPPKKGQSRIFLGSSHSKRTSGRL